MDIKVGLTQNGGEFTADENKFYEAAEKAGISKEQIDAVDTQRTDYILHATTEFISGVKDIDEDVSTVSMQLDLAGGYSYGHVAVKDAESGEWDSSQFYDYNFKEELIGAGEDLDKVLAELTNSISEKE